ncbi:MAG: MBOAT family protein [Cyclobacteriaceae bacterium]|jgi:D-alanyl-lipoteichoic acid acyltransferase DltB (MBOAT superfamily)|nr:MBOAT family protein [Cyclobacteriaceae bacterium]
MFSIDTHKLANELLYQPDAPLIFNSGIFLFLFLFFLLVYVPLSKTHRPKLLFVTLFSLYFYYKSSGWYFLLLLSTVAIDYHLAAAIGRARNRGTQQILLALSIIANLGVLGYFKYTNFFVEWLSPLAGVPFQPLDIFLPVGISFFTFQSMSYTMDVYRGHLKPVNHILDYAFFVSFFPQLVAGPIVRAADFLPQLNMPTVVTRAMFGRGIFLITTGLFKKAIISNYISLNFVDRVFEAPALYSGLENLMAVYGYALQIYCDFSGYSDMAIGIALLLGFHFNLNFDSPYQSKNITEFWRRWHMSLSSWLRDYLYISLGGNRKGRVRTYLNLFLTMLLGGLWHGAAWRFVWWGALHGLALAVHKAFAGRQGSEPRASRGVAWLSTLLTFHFVCFCWIFFRAADMQVATDMLRQMAYQFHGTLLPEFVAGYPWVVALMALGYVLHFVPARAEHWAVTKTTQLPLVGQAALLAVVILCVVQTKSASIQPFIYFQF